MSDVVRVHSDTNFLNVRLFQAQLEADPGPAVFRQHLNSLNQAQESLFRTRYNDDDTIRHLVYGRTWAIDQLLNAVWQQQQWTGQCALVAVGGYGRGELLPHSDIDLLLLFESDKVISKNEESIQAFITFLWDMNLIVGHSVRTPKGCADQAKGDLTIITTLMENRLVCGHDELRLKLREHIEPSRKLWSSKDFYQAKREEQNARHNKYNETEYNLEPNVKSSPGGLRDVQTIGWVAKRHFGDSRNRDLVSRGFLTQPEYQALRSGLAFLWRIRFALHLITNREEDRILFDLQSQVAELFGYQDVDGKMAVESLMQDYYRWVIRLRSLTDMLLQYFDELILQDGKKDKIAVLNDRFQIRNGAIEARHNQIFREHPSALMEVFTLMAKTPEISGIRAETIRLIRQHRHLIDDSFREDQQNKNLFIELLRCGKGVSTNLLRMNRYGILGLYLPEFGRIVGQMQHDLFHIYTVDAHTLLVIRNLRKFRHPDNTEQYPLVSDIIRSLPKIELAYMAALYHDIAKGRGGDHSQLGYQDALNFCARHGISESDTKLVTWLVRHHLVMSVTAQKKDISDPTVVNDFADLIPEPEYLDYLYAMTVADINATNPTIWNSWKSSLLRQLYIETRRILQSGIYRLENRHIRIANKKRESVVLLKKEGFSQEEIDRILGNPGDEYFLRESAENIAWHCKAIRDTGPNIPCVLIRDINEESYGGATQIFVYAPDRPHLFADIAKVMEIQYLNIHDARIMTSDSSNYSLDTFIVLDEDDEAIGKDKARIADIQEKLTRILTDGESVRPVQRRVSRRLKHFNIPTQVDLKSDVANQRTQVEVLTVDRPGLLAEIGQLFREFNVIIQNARISTLGERVEDVFFVVDEKGNALSESLGLEIKDAMEKRLNQFQQED